MSNTIIKAFSAIILAFVVFINSIGNFIGVGDIIPTQPEEESTTAVEIIEFDEEAAAEFLAFFNAETAKIANGGSYTLERKAEYTKSIDVGAATGLLNGIIGAIDENSNLDSVVGDFLGIGTTKRDIPEDAVQDDYRLKATALSVEGLTSFSENNGVYTFTIANATNPKKDGTTPFSNFTSDFVTHEEVVDGIESFTSAITVTGSKAEYKNITVKVTVAEEKITSVDYSYDFDAEISLKAGVKINGTGSIKTTCEYSEIKY